MLMGWLVECRERDQSRRYGDQVRAVKGWKRHAGAVLSVGVAVAGVLAWAASAASADEAAGGGVAAARHVVIVGIGGLLWSDVSPSATPNLWRVAGQGAVGSLDVSGVRPRTCAVDGWLTLNGAARAAVPEPGSGTCPGELAVVPRSGLVAAGMPVGAWVPRLGRVEAYNEQFHWDPQWGLLGSVAGEGAVCHRGGAGGRAGGGPAGWVGAWVSGRAVRVDSGGAGGVPAYRR